MNIQNNISLKPFNTFGIDAIAKRFISVNTIEELKEIIAIEKDVFLLSGGSNLLLTKDIDKLVVHINILGKKIEHISNTEVLTTINAGENWHEFVIWCIENNFGGLENLSLIPGFVGSSPIQNIGAYGVEVKDHIKEVTYLNLKTNELKTIQNKDCDFSYRHSVFKKELKGKVVITSVTFKLTKKKHQLNYSYGAIQNELNANNISIPSLKNISDAIIKIRNSKLPNPKEIGNSGSFFKNPVISKKLFSLLKRKYPDIPSYIVSETEVKIPAGWLIEQSGFKGKRFGETGSHKNQALVLVNYGNATGKEIYEMALKIQATILEKFSIPLEIEVNII